MYKSHIDDKQITNLYEGRQIIFEPFVIKYKNVKLTQIEVVVKKFMSFQFVNRASTELLRFSHRLSN